MAANSLAMVPGLGGFLESQAITDQREAGTIQNAQRLQSVIGAQQEQQEMGRIRQIMQSGGSPEQVISALVSVGPKGAAMAQQYAGALKSSQEAKVRERMASGAFNLKDPDQLEQLGASGIPGTAHLTAQAGRLRAQGDDTRALQGMQGTPTDVPVTRSVVAPGTTEAAAIARLRAQGPGSVTIGAPGDEHSVAQDSVRRLSGGAFESLMQSNIPDIAQAANRVQQMVNSGQITAKQAETRLSQLEARQTAIDAAREGRQFTVDNRREPAAAAGTVGARAPVGFRFKEDGLTLEAIPGGPKDTTINLAGGRESVYVQRMMMGANQAAKDLANVVQLPLTASTGIFGGRKQGHGLLDATKEILANKATTQEAQAYSAMAAGFQRSLAQIESAGLMPSGSLTGQMDAVIFKEGDTNLTKMHKLAQTRQIVEAGMEVIEANPRVSPDEKSKIKSVLTSVRSSVPFTHSDLIALQTAQEQNPNTTLQDILKAKPASAWTPEKERRLQELRDKKARGG